MQTKGYVNATYSAGSDSESGSSVDESLKMQLKVYFSATYSAGSSSEINFRLMRVMACIQTVTSMLLIMLEVSIKSNHLYTRVIFCRQKATSAE